MISYNIDIEKIHVVNTQTNQNCVVTVLYRVIGTDESGNSDFIMDCADFEVSDNMENFVPFEELTKEIVESWILVECGEAHIENLKNIIKDKINYKVNPPTKPEEVSFPWNK